ncbi:MAG: hypothetical protein JXA67_20355 [Micromonosporaceae bacterium]|nr:hypothetical protein [Micromonosporaceae bacterium]
MLCIKLGWRSVDQMRRGMTAGEWNRWKVYFAREGQRRELAAEQARG